MNKFWERVEHFNKHLIFPAIVVLLVVIVLEIFVKVENPTTRIVIEIADYLIIAIFVVDLVFLAIHAKNTKFFFKNYWLDILAVFPFSVLFGFTSGLLRLFAISEETVGVGQAIFHEGLEIEKAAVRTENLAKVGRSVKVGARIARIVSKTRLFTRFHHRPVKHMRI